MTLLDNSVAVAFEERLLHRQPTRYWVRKLIPRGLIATGIIFFLSASLARAQTADYLSEPIDEKAREPYRDLLKKKLVPSAGNYGVITFMPAGSGEWAVAVDSIRHARQEPRGYRLTLSSAVENLYQAKLDAEQKAVEVPVKRTSIKIDRDFALAIQRAWRAILSKDPPDQAQELQSITLDGFSADFSVRMPDGKRITRRAYSPQVPPASEIVNLAQDLREYCLGPSSERKRRRNVLIEKLNAFNKQFATSSDSLSSQDYISSQPTLKMSPRQRIAVAYATSQPVVLEKRPGQTVDKRQDNRLSPAEQRIVGAWSWTYIEGVGRIIFTPDHKVRAGFPPDDKDGRRISIEEFDIVQAGTWRLEGDALVTEIDNAPLLKIIGELDPDNAPRFQKVVERRRIIRIDGNEMVFDDGSSLKRTKR